MSENVLSNTIGYRAGYSAGYDAGWRDAIEAAAKAASTVNTIIDVYNSPLNGMSHPVAEDTRAMCAAVIRALPMPPGRE